MSEYLFPARLSRRDFIAMGAAAAATAAIPSMLRADDAPPARFGSGKWTYTWDQSWGVLPAGMHYGFGCGIVVDSQDRIYVTSRSDSPCVAIFDRDGKLLETWSKDFGDKVGYTTAQVAASAHGIYLNKEGDQEFLYFTENVVKAKPGQPPLSPPLIGARVYKTDLKGKVLYTIGNVEKESSDSQKFDWTNPTDVAISANGDIYVVDGYGSQRVSRFDKNFKHIRTIGGRGKEHGQFNICHGIWVNTLGNEPEVYIADRANGRYEVYSLDLDYKRTVSGSFVRNPCCFYQHAGHLYIPDLGSLVAIIDPDDQPVATLGDGKMADKNAPDKFATPHALTVDSQGSIYVVEWVPTGRVRKLKHTPNA
jgi:sugar lactone lactonase YvrE